MFFILCRLHPKFQATWEWYFESGLEHFKQQLCWWMVLVHQKRTWKSCSVPNSALHRIYARVFFPRFPRDPFFWSEFCWGFLTGTRTYLRLSVAGMSQDVAEQVRELYVSWLFLCCWKILNEFISRLVDNAWLIGFVAAFLFGEALMGGIIPWDA